MEGSDYEFLMGSDIHRDSMFLELRDPAGGYTGEVFYSDATATMVVTLEQRDLPIEIVEALLSRAKARLPPSPTRGSTSPDSAAP